MSPCSAANTPRLAQLAANANQLSGTALPRDSIEELWIYKANDEGYPGGAGSTAWVCDANCIRYKWVAAKDQFRYYSGAWQSATIAACANNAPDAVGIYMTARHPFITGLFSNGIDIDDHAVFAFEPLPALTCASGAHT